MDMEKFIELVKEALEKKTGKEVIVHKTVKNNGVTVIRQIKCGLIPQIKNNFLRYAEAL